jgi:hypothetical protein
MAPTVKWWQIWMIMITILDCAVVDEAVQTTYAFYTIHAKSQMYGRVLNVTFQQISVMFTNQLCIEVP